MDLENGDQVPQSPEAPHDDEAPFYPDTDSEIEMDTGMLGLLKTCSGREDVKKQVMQDADEILKMVRDLGGSVKGYRKERNKAMKGIVSEIYSAPRSTKTIKMMPSSEVLAGFALDLTTHDSDGRAWDFDDEEMRRRARKKVETEEPMFLIGAPFCRPYGPLHAL